MRRSDSYLLFTCAVAAVLGALVVHGAARAPGEGLLHARQLVHREMLTDLALFTEARYTRHPSQADRHAPFQDHPLSLEHFPSGSLVPPRRGLP